MQVSRMAFFIFTINQNEFLKIPCINGNFFLSSSHFYFYEKFLPLGETYELIWDLLVQMSIRTTKLSFAT